MLLKRTQGGLLILDPFTRAIADDDPPGYLYTQEAGVWTLQVDEGDSNNRHLRSPGGSTDHQIISLDPGIVLLSEMVVQGRLRRSHADKTPRLYAKWDGSSGFAVEMLATTFTIERLSTAARLATVDTATLTASLDTYYTIKLHVADSLQEAWVNAANAMSGTNADENHTGRGAVGGGATGASGFSDCDDLAVYRNNSVVVNNLPTDWDIVVGGKIATESSGTATIDLAELTMPQTDIQIRNDGDLVQLTFTPDGGIWGGDIFDFDQDDTVFIKNRDIDTGLLLEKGIEIIGEPGGEAGGVAPPTEGQLFPRGI